MLEARDIVMEHEFDFILIFGDEVKQENYNFFTNQY